MFHLPDVIIDLIYSFDDNAYNKRKYWTVIKELDMWYSWRRTKLFIDNRHSTYSIYHAHHVRRNNPVMNISKYILEISKRHSHDVYVNSMKWKLRKLKHTKRHKQKRRSILKIT